MVRRGIDYRYKRDGLESGGERLAKVVARGLRDVNTTWKVSDHAGQPVHEQPVGSSECQVPTVISFAEYLFYASDTIDKVAAAHLVPVMSALLGIVDAANYLPATWLKQIDR